jgi:hypothetical protein
LPPVAASSFPSKAPSLWHVLTSRAFSHICSFFPEEAGGKFGRGTKAISSVWSGGGGSTGVVCRLWWATWVNPFVSCPLTTALQVSPNLGQKKRWAKKPDLPRCCGNRACSRRNCGYFRATIVLITLILIGQVYLELLLQAGCYASSGQNKYSRIMALVQSTLHILS